MVQLFATSVWSSLGIVLENYIRALVLVVVLVSTTMLAKFYYSKNVRWVLFIYNGMRSVCVVNGTDPGLDGDAGNELAGMRHAAMLPVTANVACFIQRIRLIRALAFKG